jgi:hypothetical protein
MWLNPNEWSRAGQGRSWDLPSLREEVVAAVQAIADKADEEFDVILCDRVRPEGERLFRSRHRVVPLQELLAADVTNQFLRSKRLTPAIPDGGKDWDWAAACSLNGLILVQRALGSHPPRMGIVPRVENRSTGERVEHVEYDRLFQTVKRRLRRTSGTA